MVVAHGVHETGRREILSIDVGEAETEAFWTDFLRGLVARGLIGAQLAISDAHAGLRAAIAKVLGYAWQRCTMHFLRDCLGHARKDRTDSRVARSAARLGQRGRCLAQIAANPLELAVTRRRRSGRPVAVSPANSKICSAS